MKLYLAGPMTNRPEFGREAFARAAALLRARGHEVVTPHDLDAEQGHDWAGCAGTLDELDAVGFDREAAMRRNFAVIDGADGVALLGGWSASTGTRDEIRHANVVGVPTFLAPTEPDGELVRLEIDVRVEVGSVAVVG